jgi:hypothetical protein
MTQDVRTPGDKPEYAPPTLSVYGGVAQLTATGTVTSGENSGSMAANMA